MPAVLARVHSTIFILAEIGTLFIHRFSDFNIFDLFSVALAIASGRIELPVQSSTYPSIVIDTMLSMLHLEPDRRPSIREVIDKLADASRSTINIA